RRHGLRHRRGGRPRLLPAPPAAEGRASVVSAARDRIVVVGSLNADFVVTVDRFPAPGETVPGGGFSVFPGGKGADQAFAAARLGGRVAMVGRVGDDANAGLLRGSLVSAGADVAHVGTDPAEPTGVAIISIDGAGQNQIVVVPGANGAFDVEALERSRE